MRKEEEEHVAIAPKEYWDYWNSFFLVEEDDEKSC